MLSNKEFELLWKNSFSTIYNFFYYSIMNHHISEDLTSITFMKLFGKFDSYDAEKALPITYLMAIARNTLRDYYCLKNDDISIDDITYEPSESFESSTLERITLYNILSRLSPRDRHILYYRYYLDMSYSSVAVIMGISVTNATTICSRALKKAKKIYENM